MGLAKRSQLMKKRSESKLPTRPLLSDWVKTVPIPVDKGRVQSNQSEAPTVGTVGTQAFQVTPGHDDDKVNRGDAGEVETSVGVRMED
ncbi:hypothetical protein V6N13_028336 [Hibiscus sabdariffa]|uniref:Uncharacterized protein n=1 Tax=Hibiscus sabdariffa TaxID=183260 RepID=A0ABR2DDK6_9ROSI